ncbi:hypothetical protein ACFL5V_05620 [Fibrobacterota bacterium]
MKFLLVFMVMTFITSLHSVTWAEDKTETKNVTLISAQSTADGKSKFWKELLEECIVSLPRAADLEAEVESQTQYLKEVNGKKGQDKHTKTYAASLEINYMLYQKRLMIVTTSSVQGQEPVMKEVEGKVKKTKKFTSNSTEGDIYAGRSNRQYYFSSSEGAVKDVKKRAAIWLKQQSAVVCKDK